MAQNRFVSMDSTKILLIYTGGTIGMVQDSKTGQLRPMNFGKLRVHFPELERFDFPIDTYSFAKPVDSSAISPAHWIQIAEVIEKNYASYSGFVVLHGSDTMSFTASALSFMFEHLGKPVVLTGSQLPVGILRTDAKENLITSIEIAATRKAGGEPMVPEVSLYFEYQLYRGNRSHKFNAEDFEAFRSVNYPVLAEAGVSIKYNEAAILPLPTGAFRVNTRLSDSICAIRLFPGISFGPYLDMLENRRVRAVVIQSFGTGNGPNYEAFESFLRMAQEQDILVLNTTQCRGGKVVQGLYESSGLFVKYGAIGGEDITFEAAVTKLMLLLGNHADNAVVRAELRKSLRGEMSNAGIY